MPPLEPPTKELLALITKEKADFVEKQVNDMYDFVLESREILTKEAHTTLQWLFAILVGAAGYLVTLFAKQYDPHPLGLMAIWWVIGPLTMVVIGVACEALRLIKDALRAKKIRPKGNTAQSLIANGLAKREEHKMRFLDAWSMHERITLVLKQNGDVGNAINRARMAVIAVPAAASMLLLILLFCSLI